MHNPDRWDRAFDRRNAATLAAIRAANVRICILGCAIILGVAILLGSAALFVLTRLASPPATTPAAPPQRPSLPVHTRR